MAERASDSEIYSLSAFTILMAKFFMDESTPIEAGDKWNKEGVDTV
jgi:hypothetical protein